MIIELDRGRKIGKTACCERVVFEESQFCPGCRSEIFNLVCPSCDGSGTIIDELKITSQTINVPYRKCPVCYGTGEV